MDKHDQGTQTSAPHDSFANAAEQDPGLLKEFVGFLRHNKKWWLAPILVAIVLLAGLVFLAASPAAPFIYTLF